MSRRRASTLLALVAVGTLTACSSGGPGGGGGGDLTYEDSPLAEIFAQIDDTAEQSQEDAQAEMDEQNRQVEQLVSACMADEGFEYIPVDNSGTVVFSDETDIEDMNTEEYVAEHGYGFTTYEEQEAPAEDEYVDPNADYVAAMSETEQAAYYEALWGPATTEEYDEDEEIPEYDWTQGGCYGAAQHEVYEGEDSDNYWSDPQFEELFEEMNGLWEDAMSDPRIAELDAEWASCMADAGYADFATSQEAQDSIMNAQNALWESGEEPDDEAMAELRQQEIDTALADFRCKQDVDYEQTQLEIQFELEREFVEEHQTELDALVAAHGQDQ
ncbi:hypothetical protein Bcav_2961 [Beutenbergia cavernae DSM 12333]|uniref:Lipoprotein n=1 Tax=Beutenbergia cavernae (strain ATCC BAA-8 / DSM 12333 / CCUG 43141 / JCM 11478 / NBRC 16432 / NCIMB 13614 / HKI 0122) TaxID=471853 RepID=C5BZ91_BEUC1|nr:hypothetical protein [Beutenbergia cavernae]ACQ81206.1 hypothetical protein Bcav_2961 [Beutenbergia cavernae DSM 12333]